MGNFYCPRCSKQIDTTSGICACGNWSYSSDPVCVMCDNPSKFTAILPYGSVFDGYHICADCIKRHIDPVIACVKTMRAKLRQ